MSRSRLSPVKKLPNFSVFGPDDRVVEIIIGRKESTDRDNAGQFGEDGLHVAKLRMEANFRHTPIAGRDDYPTIVVS